MGESPRISSRERNTGRLRMRGTEYWGKLFEQTKLYFQEQQIALMIIVQTAMFVPSLESHCPGQHLPVHRTVNLFASLYLKIKKKSKEIRDVARRLQVCTRESLYQMHSTIPTIRSINFSNLSELCNIFSYSLSSK